MKLAPLFSAEITLAPPRELGVSPLGRRRIIEITGGTFAGARLAGRVLPGGADWLNAAPGLAGYPVSATLLVAVPEGPNGVSAELIAACREIATSAGLNTGITRLGGLLVGRCLCAEAEQAKAWFLDLWAVLRPALLERTAATPRIWNT